MQNACSFAFFSTEATVGRASTFICLNLLEPSDHLGKCFHNRVVLSAQRQDRRAGAR